MKAIVCVQCGEPVESLFIEYSPTNIRLTRCTKCGKVADKYVEYELLLVLVDAVLHRKQAVRHLLFNRISDAAYTRVARWVPASTISLLIALRLYVLRESAYQHISIAGVAHVAVASVLDHLILAATAMTAMYLSPSVRAALSSTHRGSTRAYLGLAAPELLRGFALVLQVFDGEAVLLVLFALLTLSLQALALQCLTETRSYRLAAGVAVVVAARWALNLLFYSQADVARIGYIM